jgi:hypothetical protein
MYYREQDHLPVEERVVINLTYATPSLAKKLHDIRRFKKEQCFNQTELALLYNVKHQRISVLLQNIIVKATRVMQGHREQLEMLLAHLK